MKLLNRVGGAFLLAVLAIAAISGFQSPTGRPIWDNLWNATRTTLMWFSDRIGGFRAVEGHGRAAIGWAATGVLLVLILVKKPVSFQQFTLLLLAGVAVAFVLWDPAILP